MQLDTLLSALMTFYGDCLTTYPELLTDPALAAIERAMREPSDLDGAPEDNPAFRLMFFLSEYREASALPSYAPLYEAARL